MKNPMPRRISNDELDAALTAIDRHLDFTDLPASRDQLCHEIQSITLHIERKREKERTKEEEVRRLMEQLRRERIAYRPLPSRPRYMSQLAASRPFWPEAGFWAVQLWLRILELLAFLFRSGHRTNSRYYWAGFEVPARMRDFDGPGADRENSGMRRMAATTIFMYSGFIFWVLLATAFSSVLSLGAASAVGGVMTVVIGLVVRVIILGWGAREPAGPAVEIWKPRD